MNELTNGVGSDVAVMGSDPFKAYAEKVGRVGTFLSFSKGGNFTYGKNPVETLPLGTRLVANVGGLRIGWRRWFEGKVTDDFMEPLADRVPLQPRNALGDNDPDLWEKDEITKEPRDPWQLTNELTLVNSEGETFLYGTSSKGGIGAIGRLCGEYYKGYRQRPGMVPIVELGNGSYQHKISRLGLIYFPVFSIVNWADEAELAAGIADDLPFDGADLPAEKPAAKPAPAPATKGTKF